MDEPLSRNLLEVAAFFDERQVGDVGPLGFRRSTHLKTLLSCIDQLTQKEIVRPGKSAFLDLGCADGRVNLLFSYLTNISVGVELDDWTLDEYEDLLPELKKTLKAAGAGLPRNNIFLFHGDATDPAVHRKIARETGFELSDFDLFYTYLIMHEEYAAMLSEHAKKGSIYMVYGLDNIMPQYSGFRLMKEISPMEGVLALYEKV